MCVCVGGGEGGRSSDGREFGHFLTNGGCSPQPYIMENPVAQSFLGQSDCLILLH